MFYIRQTTCISPQQTFSGTKIDLSQEYESVDNKMNALEPPYPGIPPNILRRMAKAVRMGVGTALPLIKGADSLPQDSKKYSQAGTKDPHGDPHHLQNSTNAPASEEKSDSAPAGIIIGTANGGMEESVKFLKQIVDYNEEMLTPGNFVQSIPNAIASQISLLSQNKGYNTTHVHRGLAFENAVIDTAMLVAENPGSSYLVGGVDEIATYHFNLEYLEGSYKKEPVSGKQLYEVDSPGSIAGEGAVMFLVGSEKTDALAKMQGLITLHSEDETAVTSLLQEFLDRHIAATGERPDLFLTGENGDSRIRHFYEACEATLDKALHNTITDSTFPDDTLPTSSSQTNPGQDNPITGNIPPRNTPGIDIIVARYKHMSGEYPTATAFALWIACQVLNGLTLPPHMVKQPGPAGQKGIKNVLIYNNYKGRQHSFMWVSR